MMSVRKRAGSPYLVIDFRCRLPDGRLVRCVESTGLIDNKTNRRIAGTKDRAIKYELGEGTFNYLHFFPEGSKAAYFRSQGKTITLTEFWDTWSTERVLRRSTKNTYRSAWNHIGPALGDARLSDIDESRILVFQRQLADKGLKAATVNKYVSILCNALYRAHRRKLISTYPCAEVRKVKGERRAVDPFSFDELADLLKDLKNRDPAFSDLVLFWSMTGLRPGELFALKWQKIDYFNHKIVIDETRVFNQDGPPKTDSSFRSLDMRPAIEEILRRQEARTRLKSNFVFLNREKPWEKKAMLDVFKRYLTLARIRYRPPQQMRHTFASLALGAGEQISWVSHTLGHADAMMTLRVYNRFIPNLTRDDGSALEKALGARFGNNLATMERNLLK